MRRKKPAKPIGRRLPDKLLVGRRAELLPEFERADLWLKTDVELMRSLNRRSIRATGGGVWQEIQVRRLRQRLRAEHSLDSEADYQKRLDRHRQIRENLTEHLGRALEPGDAELIEFATWKTTDLLNRTIIATNFINAGALTEKYASEFLLARAVLQRALVTLMTVAGDSFKRSPPTKAEIALADSAELARRLDAADTKFALVANADTPDANAKRTLQ